MAELKPVFVNPASPGRFYEPKAGDKVINDQVVVVEDIAALRLIESDKFKIVDQATVLNKGTDALAFYQLDRFDNATADDGDTVIVDADGGRWKIKKNLNRPAISAGDAGKIERVKSDESGWENVDFDASFNDSDQSKLIRKGISTNPNKIIDLTGYTENRTSTTNSFTHPHAIHIPEGWNGYKYWMAITPFPPKEDENPHIYASNNLNDWEEPAGITNPVVERSFVTSEGYSYNSDPFLILLPDDTMRMYFRPAPNPAIYATESSDGVSWSTPVKVLDSTMTTDSDILSPSVILEGSTYTMYYSEQVSSSDFQMYKRTSSDGLSSWSSRSSVTIQHNNSDLISDSGLFSSFNIDQAFHSELRKINDTYYLFVTNPNASNSLRQYLYTSQDGATFTSDLPPIPKLFGEDDSVSARPHYKSTFVPTLGDPVKFSAILSLRDYAGVDEWRLGLIKDVNIEKLSKRKYEDFLINYNSSKSIFLDATSFEGGTLTNIASRSPYRQVGDIGYPSIRVMPCFEKDIKGVEAYLYWFNDSTSSGDVVFQMYVNRWQEGVGITDGSGALGESATPAKTVTADSQGNLKITNLGNVTIIDEQYDKDNFLFPMYLQRRAGDAGDTLSGNVGVLGVKLVPLFYFKDF